MARSKRICLVICFSTFPSFTFSRFILLKSQSSKMLKSRNGFILSFATILLGVHMWGISEAGLFGHWSQSHSHHKHGPCPSYSEKLEWVYSSYQSTPYCTPSSETLFPSTIVEIRKIIISALLSGKTVKAFGSRHSITDIICTDGIPVSMSGFQKKVLNSNGTATFGAGVKMGDALEFLKRQGRSFVHIPGYVDITIGGAIGTGAHGSSLKHKSSLSEQVVRLKLVDGLGRIHTINGHDLNTFRVHLGLLGIITEITLETVPLFKMKAERTLEPDSILNDGTLLRMAEIFDFIQVAWFPSKQKVVVVKGMYTSDLSLPGDSVVTLFTNLTRDTALSLRNAYDAIHDSRNIPGFLAIEDNAILALYQKVVGRVPIYTEDYTTLTNPAVGFGYKLMSGGCSQCAWSHGNTSLEFDESAIGCDISELPGIVKTVKRILAQIPASFPFSGIAFRFSSSANAVLAMANGRKSVIVDMIYPNRIDSNKPRAGLGGYQAISQALVEKHGGRPHWGKNGLYYHTTNIIHKAVPMKNLQKFKLAMLRYDPLGVFHNKFSKRLIGNSFRQQMDVDPAITHCSLREHCVCRKDGDCGADQICSIMMDVDGTLEYRVCRDIKVYNNNPVGPYDAHNLTSILVAIFS